MNPSSIRGASAAFILTAFVACGKEIVLHDEPAPEQKREENIVTLTVKNLAHVTIKTELVALGSLEIVLRAPGRVSADMNKTAKVASTLAGRLMKLNFDLNDRVKVGDALGLVQTPELLGRPLKLKSPIDGVIATRASTVGELVDNRSDIYTISDPTDLWVLAEVKERDTAAVEVGHTVTFRVLAYPDREFGGKITRVGNQLEADSRTLEVRIATDNAEGRLKPGMFADVEIVTKVKNDVLVIPDTALQSDGDNQTVFIALGDRQFEASRTPLGMKQRGRAQVLDGLKAGEEVVTDGSFILKSELLKGELGEK